MTELSWLIGVNPACLPRSAEGWPISTQAGNVLKIATAINLCAGECSFTDLLCHLWNCKSSIRQIQAQFSFCRAAYVQLEVHPSGNAGRCAYSLAFQFSFSASPPLLCFVNFIVGRCFDMLMCKENLPAAAQGEAMPKPGRLIRMFLQVHITPHQSQRTPSCSLLSACPQLTDASCSNPILAEIMQSI